MINNGQTTNFGGNIRETDLVQSIGPGTEYALVSVDSRDEHRRDRVVVQVELRRRSGAPQTTQTIYSRISNTFVRVVGLQGRKEKEEKKGIISLLLGK